jgi:hypothetical protein
MNENHPELQQLTSSVVTAQAERESRSLSKAKETPAEKKLAKIIARIGKRAIGKPVTDEELRREQIAMKRRSSDRKTGPGQIQMHGSLDQPER